MVIAVDGEDVTGIDGDLVISRILGPAGTKVTLTILREGEPAPLEIEITRAKITIPTLDGEILEGDIAYVQLFQFGGASGDDLRETLAGLLEQNPEGLILDLRNNGGGLLTSAIQVTSEFISDGVLLYQEYGDGERDIHRAKRGGLATEIPLVVLINEGSASASEILAGAVQDYERGLLVGTTSFGKGTVQITLPLMNEQGAVKITIARWLTPNERQIGEIGIEPDFEVPITEEDLTEDRDPQLEKAIELLKDGP
jgi:carboxyl-terminal processing protease